MERIVQFDAARMRSAVTHQVYARARWGDPWLTQLYLHCDSATWSVAPSMPTATLHHYYGTICRSGALAFSRDTKRHDLLRCYVMVEFTTHDTALSGAPLVRPWYGVIEVIEDQLGGAALIQNPDGSVTVEAMGEQTFTAYGLEQLLAQHLVTHSHVLTPAGEQVTIERGVAFNDRGRPNRHHSVPMFAPLPDLAVYWSTRQIVAHLCEHQTPGSRTDERRVPFGLDVSAQAILPDWDQPELYTHHQSTYDLLSSLIARQRLMTWYLDVHAPTGQVLLCVATINESPVVIDLPDAVPVPANTARRRLLFDTDPSAAATLKTSAIESYDQVVARGRRRRSVFSVGFADATIDEGWTPAAGDAYDEGAKYASDLPAASERTERRKRHAKARARGRGEAVYVRFVLPWAWDGMVGAGDGGGPIVPALPVVLADGSIDPHPAPHYALGLTVEPTLPLLEGLDYSDDRVKDGSWEVPGEDFLRPERGPLVAWKVPGKSMYVDVEQLGRAADLESEGPAENFTWSCEVRVPPHDRALELTVHGQPQHVIAHDDFTPTSEDDVIGEHTYRDMICTICVEEDRHAEGRFPSDAELSHTPDIIRRKTLSVGDTFRQDYVCPYAVVAISDKGELVRSNGGFVHDDTPTLHALAKVAYQWYAAQRQVLYLQTDYVPYYLMLGNMITAIGVNTSGHHAIINTIVTEMRIATPRHEGAGQPQPARFSFATNWGELDPLQLVDDSRPHKSERPIRLVDGKPISFRSGALNFSRGV